MFEEEFFFQKYIVVVARVSNMKTYAIYAYI